MFTARLQLIAVSMLYRRISGPFLSLRVRALNSLPLPQDEWEKELERLTSRFERELQTKKKRPEEQKVLTLRHQQEREDLEKNMTIRRDKKKESITRKLLEHER